VNIFLKRRFQCLKPYYIQQTFQILPVRVLSTLNSFTIQEPKRLLFLMSSTSEYWTPWKLSTRQLIFRMADTMKIWMKQSYDWEKTERRR